MNKLFTLLMMKDKPICQMMMIPKTKNININFGKLENLKESGEIKNNEGRFRKRKNKFKEGVKWIMKRFSWRTRLWDLMQQIIKPKRSMFICKNTTTRVLFTRTLMTKYLSVITTSQPLYRCKISQCCHRSCKNVKEISARKVKVSTLTWQPKTQQTSTHWLDRINPFLQVGRRKWGVTKAPVLTSEILYPPSPFISLCLHFHRYFPLQNIKLF